MTLKTEALLKRLAEIGQSIAGSEGGLGLIALGSVGQERDRLDDYSDLDFFVAVAPGYKAQFLADLSWLAGITPLAFVFQNTADGHKVLFVDGIFCEYAVFEPEELKRAAYADGVWVWRHEGFAEGEEMAGKRPLPTLPDQEWLIGEALTNLYIGLGRFHRGEKLSAMRFIQGYAVDRVLELAPIIETEQPAHRDPFSAERRIEQRFSTLADALPTFLPGYENSISAAASILKFLDDHFEINQAMRDEILKLIS